MDWGFLSFLAEPWFVIPWYAIGVLGAIGVGVDLHKTNTPLKKAMKWAWPIIILFFSVIGLALYFGTARAPGIGEKQGEEAKKKAHMEYEKNMFRRVNGAVIHCIAGDGLGIMTGMVIARDVGMSFWQEFWFEYAVGFLFGWFIFQFKSMTMMTDSKGMALLMAFRAEFFSMLTVMAGMGAVMAYVTPMAVTAQPKPLTYAFWGFGMLGLIVGYVLTFPMNWMMVKVGWKHGMGGEEGANPVEGKAPKAGLVTAMVALGAAALVLPGWLAEVRQGTPIGPGQGGAMGTGGSPPPELAVLGQGLHTSLEMALHHLDADQRSKAVHEVDAALRVAEVGKSAAPGSPFKDAVEDLKGARHALHMGREPAARGKLRGAAQRVEGLQAQAPGSPPSPGRFDGAMVINANGVDIGEVTGVQGDQVELTLGGARDVWGFVDLGSKQSVRVPASSLVFGPSRLIGSSLVALPTRQTPPLRGMP